MQILKKKLLKVNNNVLICGLYTLYGNDKIFKKYNLKKDLYIDVKNIEYCSDNVKKAYELYKLLSKTSIKHLAFELLNPFLKTFPTSSSVNLKIKNRNKKGRSCPLPDSDCSPRRT